MLPTLTGRVQTRIALLAVIGGLVTALICPVLPVSAPLADRYQNGFVVLAAVAVLGVGWEFVYHFLMQWRWEKDWPTLFGLVTLVPEGLLLWLLLQAGVVPGIVGHGDRSGVLRPVPGRVAGGVAGGQRADAGAVHPVAIPRREAGVSDERAPARALAGPGRRGAGPPG